jgi:hypothetical protein
VKNKNRFWIEWLDLLPHSLELKSIATAHNQCLSKTGSIPYWTTSVLSSTVTDLVLIYESVTSSASAVRWLSLHRWTLNFWIAFSILLRLNDSVTCELWNHSHSHFTTGFLLPVSSSWRQAPWDSRPVILFSNRTLGLWSFCNILSDERMGLSFTIAAGPRQRSRSQVRAPRDSWPHFTVSDSGLLQPGGPGRTE